MQNAHRVFRALGYWSAIFALVLGISDACAQDAYPSSITITGPTSVVFNRSGRSSSATTVTLQIQSSTASTVSPRCVSISLTGQPKSTIGSC